MLPTLRFKAGLFWQGTYMYRWHTNLHGFLLIRLPIENYLENYFVIKI